MTQKKKRNKVHLEYGFIDTVNGEGISYQHTTMCVVILRNEALRPSRLQRYLQTKHAGNQNKPLAFFKARKTLETNIVNRHLRN